MRTSAKITAIGRILVPTRPDGISLFGRETPAYILEEVNRRQVADRGTSSLWAKLAADYGPRHANFIVKHDTKFPTSRNDRNRQDVHVLRNGFIWKPFNPWECSTIHLEIQESAYFEAPCHVRF